MGSGERAAGARQRIPDLDHWLWHIVIFLFCCCYCLQFYWKGLGKLDQVMKEIATNEDNSFPFRDRTLGLVPYGSIPRRQFFTFIFPGPTEGREVRRKLVVLTVHWLCAPPHSQSELLEPRRTSELWVDLFREAQGKNVSGLEDVQLSVTPELL